MVTSLFATQPPEWVTEENPGIKLGIHSALLLILSMCYTPPTLYNKVLCSCFRDKFLLPITAPPVDGYEHQPIGTPCELSFD